MLVWWPEILSETALARWAFVTGVVGIPTLSSIWAMRTRLGRQNKIIEGLNATVRERDLEIKRVLASAEMSRDSAEAELPRAFEKRLQRELAQGNFELAIGIGDQFFRDHSTEIASLILACARLKGALLPGDGAAERLQELHRLVTIGTCLDPNNAELLGLHNETSRLPTDDRIELEGDSPPDYLGKDRNSEIVVEDLLKLVTRLNNGRYQFLLAAVAQRAMQIGERFPVPDGLIEGHLYYFAHALHGTTRNDVALQLARDRVDALRTEVPKTSPTFVRWQRQVAELLNTAGRPAEALSILQEIEPAARLFKEETQTYKLIRCQIVACLASVDPERGVQFGREHVAELEKSDGPLARNTSTARYYLAVCLNNAGRRDEAVQVLESNQYAQEITKGADHPDAIVNRKLAETIRAGKVTLRH